MSKGRKKIPIDWGKIDEWLEAGAKGTEIAAALGIHFDTLSKRCISEKKSNFSDYSRSKRESGNIKIRLNQMELANNKDRGMLIWLGKNRLGQRDTPIEKPKKERVQIIITPKSIDNEE